MTAIPMRQRSATEIVDASFQILRREPMQFVTAAGLIYIPWVALQVGLGTNDPMTANVLLSFVMSIASLFMFTAISAVSCVIASDVYLGQPTDIGSAFSRVGSRILTLISANILTGIATIIGMILLIIPGIYLALRFVPMEPIIMLEGATSTAVFARTGTLTEGRKWQTLAVMVLWLILTIAIGAALGIAGAVTGNKTIALVVTSLVYAIIYPMLGILKTVLYYDMRIRKEGFDVEYMLGDAGNPSATTAGA